MATNPKAEVEISAHSRGLQGKLREARSKFGKFGAELKSQVFGKDLVGEKGGFWGKGGAQLVGNLGSSAVQTAGGFLADIGKNVLDFNDGLTRLQITANKTPEEMADFARVIRQASDATGISKESILGAASGYVALTGDMQTATRETLIWAKAAQATNSTVQDMAGLAAALSQQMGIGPQQLEEAFSAVAAQGKAGAIELKDLAGLMSQIAPQWAMFKDGKGMGGLRELGAALQVVKRGFGGDAAETVTGLQSLLTALVKNSSKFQKAGIKVFDKDPKTGVKSMRSVLDIVEAIGTSKLMKDPTKLEKAFGRVEAYRAFLQLTQNKQALDDLITSSKDAGLIERDLATYMTSDAGRLKSSWEEMKNAIADAFTPERIQAFVAAIESLAQKVGPIVDSIAKVGDLLGAFYGAGQSIRSIFDTNANQNPFVEEVHSDRSIQDYRRAQHLEPSAGEKEKFARHLADKVAYDKSVDEIMGSEVGEKTTPASIQRAVLAKYASLSMPGGLGSNVAGDKYLNAAKIPEGAQQEIYAKAFGESLANTFVAKLVVALRDGDKKSIEVKVDGSKIVDAHRKAAVHATRNP